MILLVLGASILIFGVTVYQYKQEAESYHEERLERKQRAILENIKFVLASTTYVVDTENLGPIFSERDKIDEMAEVHEMQIHIYDLDGSLIIKSNESFFKDSTSVSIPESVLSKLDTTTTKHYLKKTEVNGQKYQSSYSYITDGKFKPLAILYLPYVQDDSLLNMDLNNFLVRMAEVYLFMLLIAIILSFFLSKYITKSLKIISERSTRPDWTNETRRSNSPMLQRRSTRWFRHITA